MTKKPTTADTLRGVRLMKKALEAARNGPLAAPEPVPSMLLKKMTLPNGDPVSPAMRELFKVDAAWLSIDFDEEEGEIEAVSLEDLIEDEFGEEAIELFGEAYEILSGDCIVFGGASDSLRFLYVGEPDDLGEYPVMTVMKDPPWIGGFVPFDVWAAQELGVLASLKAPGAVPPEYEEAAQALAELNGDGRLGFTPEPGAGRDKDSDDDD